MFRVTASSIEEYFAFDPARESDLRAVDEAIRAAAPTLPRWFVQGTPEGKPGMRMTMIGYGDFMYTVKSSPEPIRWPVVGLALQKNYLSLYCSARDGERPFALDYADRLGKVDVSDKGVIRFKNAGDLNLDELRAMIGDLEAGLRAGRLSLRYGRAAKNGG